MWTYVVTTGQLSRNGEHMAIGYSGNGHGRNNPAFEIVKSEGPVPQGVYRLTVEPKGSHVRLADPVLRLHPQAQTNMHGRDGFLIHGDNAQHDASDGCIIVALAVRLLIAASVMQNFPDDLLEVIPRPEVADAATVS